MYREKSNLAYPTDPLASRDALQGRALSTNCPLWAHQSSNVVSEGTGELTDGLQLAGPGVTDASHRFHRMGDLGTQGWKNCDASHVTVGQLQMIVGLLDSLLTFVVTHVRERMDFRPHLRKGVLQFKQRLAFGVDGEDRREVSHHHHRGKSGTEENENGQEGKLRGYLHKVSSSGGASTTPMWPRGHFAPHRTALNHPPP
jgi:hypothetical protein